MDRLNWDVEKQSKFILPCSFERKKKWNRVGKDIANVRNWDNIKKKILKSDLKVLVRHARQRGRDSSGFIFKSSSKETVTVSRADFDIKTLQNRIFQKCASSVVIADW